MSPKVKVIVIPPITDGTVKVNVPSVRPSSSVPCRVHSYSFFVSPIPIKVDPLPLTLYVLPECVTSAPLTVNSPKLAEV